ncbi:MAG TPA: DUF2760 domain-containing protein, partial [Candidatus Sulfotelmatobacter sp.]|nr:DUF2760 domain-containing protein [Candidatus Sulfotelmatobacter sp.]
MERNNSPEGMSFFGRLGMAFRLVFNADFARQVGAGLQALEAKQIKPPPERVHASSLLLLSGLQREGRLIDFLQQDVASYSDEEVGAAARIVHTGCRKALQQYFEFEPAVREAEGDTITVPKSFDVQRIRLTGNVAGQPPFRGSLKHHGWVAKEIRMPELSEAIDPRVVAPAEVEL